MSNFSKIPSPAGLASGSLRYLTLSCPDSLLFRRWVHLYAQRFPFYERSPVASIAAGLLEGELFIEGLCFRSEVDRHWDWASFVCYETYPTGTLLAYLATHPDFEGRGLARQLVQGLVEQRLSHQQPYFWLEAEPKLWGFYRSQGFFQLPFTYYIPRFFGEGVVKMGLFVKSLRDVIERSTVYEMVQTLYLQSYDLAEDDPRIEKGLAEVFSLPKQIDIPEMARIGNQKDE